MRQQSGIGRDELCKRALQASYSTCHSKDFVAQLESGHARSDLFDNAEPMGASERGGVWRTALKLSLPPGALGVSAYQHSYLFSIACPRGYCVAVGSYTDVNQSNEVMALLFRTLKTSIITWSFFPCNLKPLEKRRSS